MDTGGMGMKKMFTGLNKKDTVMTLIAGGLIGALIVLLFTFIVSV